MPLIYFSPEPLVIGEQAAEDVYAVTCSLGIVHRVLQTITWAEAG